MAGGEDGASGAAALRGVPQADLIHGDGQQLQHPLDLGLGRWCSEGEAQRRVGQLGATANRQQHVRGVLRPSMAG